MRRRVMLYPYDPTTPPIAINMGDIGPPLTAIIEIDDQTGQVFASGQPTQPWGNLEGPGGPVAVGENVVYIDGARTDNYTANGSSQYPFKTIQEGVDLIARNGDNTVNKVYRIIVGPALYSEIIDLSDPKLACLVFTGWGATVSGLNIQDNDNLSDCLFLSMRFQSTGGPLLNIGSKNDGSGLGSAQLADGIMFYDCSFIGGGQSQIGQCSNIMMDRCSFPSTTPEFIFTNVNVAHIRNSYLSEGAAISLVTDSTQPGPAGFSGTTQVNMRHCNNRATVSIDAGSNFVLADGARQIGAVTVNGLFRNFNSVVTGPITVNAGGTYRAECGGVHNSSLTVNAGGTVQARGIQELAGLALSAAAPTVESGQVGFGGTTAPTASAGTGEAPPALVDGYLVINVAGVMKKIPYFAN